MPWQQRYLERFYHSRVGYVEGTTEFHRLCASVIAPESRILEVGAGPSNRTSRFLATLGEVHGIDQDPAVKGNESLMSSTVLAAGDFPFEDSSFDACVSNYVIEHVENPLSHLREVRRVLKPGGVYVFRTPNRMHYAALAASLTPHWVHSLVANRVRNLAPTAHEPYPTAYGMNTRRAVVRAAESVGFAVEVLRTFEKEPSYGMNSRALFLAFTAYERVVNATELAADLRSNIFGVLRKVA